MRGPHGALRALTLALALLTGCSSPIDSWKGLAWLKGKSAPNTLHTVGPVQVRVDSFGKPLREGQESAISREDFLVQSDKLLADRRLTSLRRWIERYPDVALEVLRTTQNNELRRASINAIAEGYDAQMGLTADGWRDVIRARGEDPQQFLEFDATRRLVLEKIRLGQAHEAATTKLTKLADATPGSMLKIDAWQLHAVALMVDDRPQESAAALTQALHFAGGDPYQTTTLLLLLSDMQRRSGQLAQADAMWLRAVENGTALLNRPAPVVDPMLWDKAAYLRPVSIPWPQTLAAAIMNPGPTREVLLVSADSQKDSPVVVETVFWSLVGQAHLDRDENQSALLALKQAETLATDPATTGWLRLQEAQALARMQQTTAATAILVGLTNHADPCIASAALATLGAQKLRADDIEAGYKMLAKAFEKNETLDWPGRARSEADYALACLMCSQEANGLRLLHKAQGAFEAAGDHESLAKSLYNEGAYLEHKKKRKEAAAIKERLKKLEGA
ncbi:MAG TPA: hypothetical protein VHZ24_20545 [Pirellulales bacterium]|nr:hypothetical protein [Pirellulales bacterium]